MTNSLFTGSKRPRTVVTSNVADEMAYVFRENSDPDLAEGSVQGLEEIRSEEDMHEYKKFLFDKIFRTEKKAVSLDEVSINLLGNPNAMSAANYGISREVLNKIEIPGKEIRGRKIYYNVIKLRFLEELRRTNKSAYAKLSQTIPLLYRIEDKNVIDFKRKMFFDRPQRTAGIKLVRYLGDDRWRELRDHYAIKFNYLCCMCGKPRRDERSHDGHEMWRCSVESRVIGDKTWEVFTQNLEGVYYLCKECHQSVHYMGEYAKERQRFVNEYQSKMTMMRMLLDNYGAEPSGYDFIMCLNWVANKNLDLNKKANTADWVIVDMTSAKNEIEKLFAEDMEAIQRNQKDKLILEDRLLGNVLYGKKELLEKIWEVVEGTTMERGMK